MNIKDLYIKSYVGGQGLSRKEAAILSKYVQLSNPIINGAVRLYFANRNKDDNDKHYIGETAKGVLAGSLGSALSIGGNSGVNFYGDWLRDKLRKRALYLTEDAARNRDEAGFRIRDPLSNFERKSYSELKEFPVNEDIHRKWEELFAKEKREINTLDDITKQRKARINTLAEKGITNIERRLGRVSKIISAAGLTLPLLYSLSPLLQKEKPKTISEKIKGLFK